MLKTTCVSKYHICIYFLTLRPAFNNKTVMEVSFIKSVYLLISFDSHGFVIHFDALQRNFLKLHVAYE